jgi:hypothetical protein
VSAEQRQGQIPIGPVVAAVGAVLLVVSLFLDWYEEVSGFTVFELVDLLLVLLALLTVFSLASGLGLVRPALSPPVSLGVALFALVVVVTQILNDPPAVAGVAGPAKDLGIWLALAGSALMLAGALLAGTQISLAVEARPRAAAPGDEDATTRETAAPRPGEPAARPDPNQPAPRGASRPAGAPPETSPGGAPERP